MILHPLKGSAENTAVGNHKHLHKPPSTSSSFFLVMLDQDSLQPAVNVRLDHPCFS